MKKALSILLSIGVLFSMIIPFSVSAANGNPVIKGSYADPDIDYFDCQYWIFPTTDGNPGWSGTQFHAFSSIDLVNWTDEGIILDVADKNPGKNAKGIQIAASKWSEGNAWAPSVEKVNGKYYFYYCGRIRADLLEKYAVKNPDGHYNDKAIGVAVADSPNGPYKALDDPILYPAMIRDLGMDIGQVIDPSVFIDDDGTPYLFFGNGIAYGVQLEKDMVTVKPSTMVLYRIWGYRESLVVFKRSGKYYFTWSDFGTDQVEYCVKYQTAPSLDGKTLLDNPTTILQMDANNAIYGTGHQSILYNPVDGQYYIAYGRHQTKNGVSVNDPGNFREVCIDKITFKVFSGAINPITPTNTGVSPVKAPGHSMTSKVTKNATYSTTGVRTYYCKNCNYSYTKPIAKLTVSKPAGVSISSKTKAFTLKWKKNTKATGYIIEYSTKSNFKSAKKITIKKNSTVSSTVKSLKSKKKYYVRIRAYKTYNKKNYYSPWVSKTVKVK